MPLPQLSSEMRAESMRRGCDTPSQPLEPSTGIRKETEGNQGHQGNPVWRVIMADLLSIKKGLKKEKRNKHHVQRLDQAIERGTHAFHSAAVRVCRTSADHYAKRTE
jgi:hypothetical protein